MIYELYVMIKDTVSLSDNITRIKGGHGGTWCYAWSLDGAKNDQNLKRRMKYQYILINLLIKLYERRY